MPPVRLPVLELRAATEEKGRQHMLTVGTEVPEEEVTLILRIAMPLGPDQPQDQPQAQVQHQATTTQTYGIGTKRDIFGRSIASSSIYGATVVVELSINMSLDDHQTPPSISLW